MNNIYRNTHEEFITSIDMGKAGGREQIISTFDFIAPGYEAKLTDVFDAHALLECLGLARQGKESRITGKESSTLKFTKSVLSFNSDNGDIGGVTPIEKDFDHFFLDAFTVIENGERKRIDRHIELGLVEQAVLDLLRRDPVLLKGFDPRMVEVAVSIMLKDMGFSRVELKRFVRDGGIDIYAIYVEGPVTRTVVVEVKRHADNVGIDFVDRLYGVRSRTDADKALMVTTSGITADAVNGYRAKTDTMAFLTFDHINDFLQRDKEHWTKSPSDLWTARVDPHSPS